MSNTYKKELMEKYTKQGGSLHLSLMNEFGSFTKDISVLYAILYEMSINNEQNERIITLLEKMAGEKKEVAKPASKKEKK